MIDQLIIGDKASYDDFSASVAERKPPNPPKKKSIKEKVPFSNVTHDFSAINGEIYWEERELEYTFEILADTPEELERLRMAFTNWVNGVTSQDIFDPYIPDYHFNGTCENVDYKDDESLFKTTVTVKFLAYPYQIANEPKIYEFTISANSEISADIVNSSSHRINPVFYSTGAITLVIDDTAYSIGAGETKDNTFFLKAGVNAAKIQNTSGTACTLTVSFIEEMF